MRTDSIIALLAVLAIATGALAQHRGSGAGHGHAAPYEGLDKRAIAALSAEDVEGLTAGRGMGFALPAELNGYPGPMHILELAEPLQLTPGQRSAVQAIFERMQARAREAGSRYVDAERALDRAFRSHEADVETVRRLAHEADRLRAEKRLAHLEAHIEAAPVLSPAQRATYAKLRGYGAR